MCKVRTKEDITTPADLQNLVTSVILRETSSFSVQDILSKTKDKVKGSPFENSDDRIKRICENTIIELNQIDCVRLLEKDRYKLAMSFPSIVSTK